MRAEPGEGISGRSIASAAPSSKRREMRVLKALRREPMTSRLITKKTTVPRRMVMKGSFRND